MPDTILTDTSAPSLRQIAERYLGQVDWKDDLTGVCRCPGHHKHTHRSTKRDCKVYLNGTPTVYCLHQSCEKEVSEANSQIRTAWALFQPEIPAADLAAAKQKAARRHELEDRARASLPTILKDFKWNVEDILAEGKVPKERHSTDEFLERMFDKDDVVWIGEPDDSGREEHRSNFQKRSDWEMLHALYSGPAYHFTCPSTFKPGTYSRAQANVASTPYLIIEGDCVLGVKPENDQQRKENKDACGAILNWLVRGVGLRLCAVIDSANRSVHGWIRNPGPDKLEELRIVLPALGCDRAMFKPTQPARLPGILRDNGNEQKLLWLN